MKRKQNSGAGAPSEGDMADIRTFIARCYAFSLEICRQSAAREAGPPLTVQEIEAGLAALDVEYLQAVIARNGKTPCNVRRFEPRRRPATPRAMHGGTAVVVSLAAVRASRAQERHGTDDADQPG